MRVLITLTPRIYREAIAFSLSRSRPDFEVRIAAPEEAEEEVRGFGPHLLLRNDTDGLDPLVLEGVCCWVEVLYFDSMDAKIFLQVRVQEEAQDLSMEELVRVAGEVADLMRQP
jgi:hypothetical protein